MAAASPAIVREQRAGATGRGEQPGCAARQQPGRTGRGAGKNRVTSPKRA
jgi:hypothetical protein